MKTIEELLLQKPIYINEFDSEVSVFSHYKEEKGNKKVLFASYGSANYSGDAWVLFEEGGKLFEVNGNHCSCFGLENQWNPEEVFLEELKNRVTVGTLGKDAYSGNEFNEELKKFIGI